MARPNPINKESEFGINELFFSRTDLRGVIVSGNDVFIRVSKYPREALIGVAHNVVRHPDMPKSVFRVFWKTIQENKPISAYVKNMAADGSYYWVFATAFPIENGYLSIRIKPTSDFFKVIPGVYQKVQEKEKKDGIDAGVDALLAILKEAGFSGYGAFQDAATKAEISARNKATAGKATQSSTSSSRAAGEGVNGALTEIAARCGLCARENTKILTKLEHFSTVNKQLTEKSALILKTLQTLDLLSVNMSTAARRIGSAGVTLVAVANGIQKSAGEFREDLKKFNASAQNVAASITKSEIQISSAQMQVDMIDFYVNELLAKGATGQTYTPETINDMRLNSIFLLKLSSTTANELRREMESLKNLLMAISMDVDQLRSTINGLEIVRKTGGIEAVQIPDGDQFNTHFQVMSELVRDTGAQLGTFGDSLRSSLRDVGEIGPALVTITEAMRELDEFIANLK